MSHIVFQEECYAIVGAAMNVYYQMGVGFAEPIYQECFAIELQRRNIPFVSEAKLELYYRDIRLEKTYRADFVCFGSIIVELKAQTALTSREESQLLNYLRITKKPLGILVNFGSRPKLEWKRYVLSLAK